jgi:hypothetical protein
MLFFYSKLERRRHLSASSLCNYLDGGAGIDDGGLDEPGQPQAEQDVEYVAADGIAHRHVPCEKMEI